MKILIGVLVTLIATAAFAVVEPITEGSERQQVADSVVAAILQTKFANCSIEDNVLRRSDSKDFGLNVVVLSETDFVWDKEVVMLRNSNGDQPVIIFKTGANLVEKNTIEIYTDRQDLHILKVIYNLDKLVQVKTGTISRPSQAEVLQRVGTLTCNSIN